MKIKLSEYQLASLRENVRLHKHLLNLPINKKVVLTPLVRKAMICFAFINLPHQIPQVSTPNTINKKKSFKLFCFEVIPRVVCQVFLVSPEKSFNINEQFRTKE